MSLEIASLEKVKSAVAHIRAHGGSATANLVIAHLGGGSKATVLRHLKTLRASDVPADAVPAAVMDLARAALTEIYAAGAKAEGDRSAAGLVRLTSALEELDTQVEELAVENEALRDRLEVEAADRERTAALVEELRTTLARTARDLQTAKNELALERGAASERLGSLMTRFEASVASMARTASSRQHRQRDPSG